MRNILKKPLLVLAAGTLFSTIALGKATEITLWEQMEPAVRPTYIKIVDEFMKKNPDVKVNVVHYSNEDLRTQFQNASLAGQGPDIVYGPNDNIGIFMVSDLIKPIDKVVSKDLIQKFNEGALKSGMYDNQLYLLPEFLGNQIALLYNKDIVANAPKNWEEFLKIAQANRTVDAKDKANSKYGFLYNEKEPFWFVGFYNGFGGEIFDSKNNPTLDNQAMIDALTFVRDIRAKYNLGEAGMDYDIASQLFKQKKAAMILNGAWSWKEYEDAGINLGVAPMPIPSKNGYALFTNASKGYSLSENTSDKKTEALNKFFDYIFSPEINAEISLNQSQAPGIEAARELSQVKNDKLMQDSIETIKYTVPMPVVPEMRAIWDAVRPNLEAVLNGKMTPEDAAKKMQKDAVDGIKIIKGE
ncbi:extracellular solute-binding protein [Cetobacterium somerae]|uniref:extracellular solute-binding protein n=1 Tax=Cetobacterium TaxID=180162 RepID=UPI00224D6ACB|nr:extracellular solute-binding protein [Cetobacterium somerae]MCX3066523.1 extracellular solute-binding protein [Cetobacterium somerae]